MHASRRRIRWALISALFLAVGVLVVGLLLPGCCVPRHPVASARVLADIAAQDAPSALKRRTPAPTELPVTYPAGEDPDHGFLYIPANGVKAGIVLVPGAAEEGARDPRLVAFARTLARANFAVLVPDIEEMRRFELGTNNIQRLAHALRFLASRPDLSPQGRLGIAAMSYAVGPAILASLQPDLRGQVAFILGVGGYYDLANVVTFITTGYFCDPAPGSPWQWKPQNAYGKWVFMLTNVERLADPSDRRVLEEMARRKLDDPDAPVEFLAEQLGSQGRAYYRLLMNGDPRRVPDLLQQLPPAVLAEFNDLNLANADLSALQAKLLLFHGRDDEIIPHTESIRLAQAAGRGRAELYLLRGLQHVNVEGMGLRDRLRLWCGMDALLRQRAR